MSDDILNKPLPDHDFVKATASKVIRAGRDDIALHVMAFVMKKEDATELIKQIDSYLAGLWAFGYRQGLHDGQQIKDLTS